MTILVTGAGGFSGRHLIRYLAESSSAEIHCTSLTARAEKNWFACDLTKKKATAALIEQITPRQIYHLAGVNSGDYHTDYRVNVLGTYNILESLAKTRSKCRILVVGSSAEYGFVAEEDNPVREDHPLTPMSVYGLTKVYQTYLMKCYCALHNMDIVMARPFNLLGKSMSGKLFVGRVYEQVEAYRVGRISKVVVGNLQHRRDYIPVEEAVRHYALIMQRGKAGEVYNVGSGVSISIRDLLQRILQENGLSMEVVEERASTGATKFDIKDLVADVAKLRALAND